MAISHAILIHASLNSQEHGNISHKKELQHLITTLQNIHIERDFTGPSSPAYHTYLDENLIDSILGAISKRTSLIIIDAILKPAQIFALTELFQEKNITVWDRIDLILHIFSAHATSAEAKLQIELARIRHMGPRIFGMGMELSRQGGGIGTKGIGETNIEIMKRHLKEQERRIVKKLEKFSQDKAKQRARRKRQNFKTISLVGYTNAGKSLLMKRLTKKQNVTVRDQLFATLDTRIGRLFLPEVRESVLVSDTIGFISNLSPQLIAAFTSTLSEAIHADLLLHVVDISDPYREEKIAVVDEILEQLQISEKKQILIFTKTDIAGKRFGEGKLRKKYKNRKPLFVSAVTKENIDQLRIAIAKEFFPKTFRKFQNLYKSRANSSKR